MEELTSSARDEDLRIAILSLFSADHRTAAEELRVGVLNGIAHLAGKVETASIREAAEELALQIEGVRGVANRIESPGAPSPSRVINLDLHKHHDLQNGRDVK